MPIDFEKLIEALMMARAVSAIAVSEARAGCHIEVDVEGCEYRREGERVVIKGKVLKAIANVFAHELVATYSGRINGVSLIAATGVNVGYSNVEITASVEVTQEATQR